MNEQEQQRLENLGPAERIVQALTTYTDHLYHGRPGIIVPDGRTNVGVRWNAALWKLEDGEKIVYRLDKTRKGYGRNAKQITARTRMGVLNDDLSVNENGTVVAHFRNPGLFPEVCVWMYKQVAEVFKLDNEFAAKWASWAWEREHRDLKVVLAAFMLVQSRHGEAVVEDGQLLFHDDDFRAVGEAMCLLPGKYYIDAKTLLRIGTLLMLPEIAEINRELGFGKSARSAPMGRFKLAVRKWLKYREQNPQMLEGLVKKGFRSTVIRLAGLAGYKPESEKFFEILRWKQKQAKDGRRTLAIGKAVKKAETWEGMSEADICQKIVDTKPDWKRIVGLLPKEVGITQAVVAAAVEGGCLSNADLIILTPTLEDLGLLEDKDVKAKWGRAMKSAENQRAANIAKRVKKVETAEALEEAAETAIQKKIEEVTRGLRIYVVVDKSGSMTNALKKAKIYLTQMMPAFPPDRVHVSVFNSYGHELEVKTVKRADENGVEKEVATAATIEHAFRGHNAGGGTKYAEGVRVLAHHKPEADEDLLVLYVGDEGDAYGVDRLVNVFGEYDLQPVAFGLLKVQGYPGTVVQQAAAQMQIPCFMIEEDMFEDDSAYGVARTLQNLIASTPVGEVATTAPRPAARRKTLVQEILETKTLQKPVWA